VQHLIEFLIPGYKRFDGAVFACISLAKQIADNKLQDFVRIRLVDDASPGFSEEEIARFDESLGPVLDEDFYNFARSAGPRRPGVSQYPGRETPQRPAAPAPVNPARGGAVFLGFEQ
jgi:hypothetical protein